MAPVYVGKMQDLLNFRGSDNSFFGQVTAGDNIFFWENAIAPSTLLQ